MTDVSRQGSVLEAIRDLIQVDVNQRGLRKNPAANLCNQRESDFAAACRTLAECPQAHVAVVTGFLIPTADPPAGETDGPLGAVFLARALAPLGIRVSILSDAFCIPSLARGLESCDLVVAGDLVELPTFETACDWSRTTWRAWARQVVPSMTHLLALERVGPSYTPAALQRQVEGHLDSECLLAAFAEAVPANDQDRCHTMRGRDITASMSPVHHLFEAFGPDTVTLGIGDGGNEIGMGRIPWSVIRANIACGDRIACRIATDRLIVAGISNWGAYGLAAGVWHLKDRRPPPSLFDPNLERSILAAMVAAGLVDGVTSQATVSVDGLAFERYAAILPALQDLLGRS